MSCKMMDFKIAKKTIRIYDVKGYGRVQTSRVLKFWLTEILPTLLPKCGSQRIFDFALL